MSGILVFCGVGANQVFNWCQALSQAVKRGCIQVSVHITALKKADAKKAATRPTSTPEAATDAAHTQSEPSSERAEVFTIKGPTPVKPCPQRVAPAPTKPASAAPE